MTLAVLPVANGLTEEQRALRPVPFAPGYFAGADGSVWSANGRRGGIRRMKGSPDQCGYIRVALSFGNGVIVLKGVHQIVCVTFNGPPDGERLEVRHLDGCKTNNVPSNLRWGTRAENAADMWQHGGHRAQIKPESYTPEAGAKIGNAKRRYWETHPHPIGSSNPTSKMTEDVVRMIKTRLATGEKHREIAASFGVSRSSVSLIAQGKTWKHVD